LEEDEELDRQSGVLPGWTIRAGFDGDAVRRHARAGFLRGLLVTLGVSAVMLLAIVYIGITAAREMRLSRAKSEFVASVSHELKTPLALIRGFAETLHLNRLGSPSDRDEYFRIIENEILKLSLMIDRILELSKIEVGLKRYHPEPADLSLLVDETLAHFSFELERSGFALERQFEEPAPRAEVDPQGFSLALLNLVSNAMKYSDSQRLIGVRVASDNGHVEVSVTDRGIGIPPGEQRRIFEKFYRIGSGPVARTKGAGLGLALVKHFAEAHGGAVRVSSSPGKGSTFTIVLPACKPA
jgi:signal transduction histidine kinase